MTELAQSNHTLMTITMQKAALGDFDEDGVLDEDGNFDEDENVAFGENGNFVTLMKMRMVTLLKMRMVTLLKMKMLLRLLEARRSTPKQPKVLKSSLEPGLFIR